MHCLYDHRGALPSLLVITDGKTSDIRIVKENDPPLLSDSIPRFIEFHDEETKKTLFFLTNHFALSAAAIAQIYKSRWQIELFFKWIKQNLKIKSFLGTSKNAVMIQIWVAMSCYLLLTDIKYQTKYAHGLLRLSRVIRETPFARKALIDILTLRPERLRMFQDEHLQTTLF